MMGGLALKRRAEVGERIRHRGESKVVRQDPSLGEEKAHVMAARMQGLSAVKS
jgi:hypothetical protein